MKLFIGCSSRPEIDKKYIEDADFISKKLADYGYDLIIGGISKEGMFGKILNNFNAAHRNIKIYTLKLYNEDIGDNLVAAVPDDVIQTNKVFQDYKIFQCPKEMRLFRFH